MYKVLKTASVFRTNLKLKLCQSGNPTFPHLLKPFIHFLKTFFPALIHFLVNNFCFCINTLKTFLHLLQNSQFSQTKHVVR